METRLSYIQIGSKVIVETSPAIATDKLNAGVYKLHYDGFKDILMFDEVSFKNDKILPLPSKEYNTVIDQMKLFMSGETKQKFIDLNYLYKRGVLLQGPPGSGKTIIVNRLVQHAVEEHKAVCLFVESVTALKRAYEYLNQSQPDQLLVVVFEEFDRLADEDEEDLLLLLDGQVQRNNVIFLATTNYINLIPKRLLRPGRMSSVVEVCYPERAVRYSYFSQKLGEDFEFLDAWADQTEGLSVDELKEIVQAVYILNEDIEETIQRLIYTRTEEQPKDDDDEPSSYSIRHNRKKRR